MTIKKHNKFIPFLLLAILFLSCTTQNIIKESAIKYVSLVKKEFNKTNSKKIDVFIERSKIKKKYYEIGIIKTVGQPLIEKIITETAVKGGHAIIKNGNDYIIIRYFETDSKSQKGSMT